MVDDSDLFAATGERAPGFEVDALDIASGRSADRILAFLDDPRFADDALANPYLRVLLVTPSLAGQLDARDGLRLVVVDDPRWTFYTLSNHLSRLRPAAAVSEVDPSARISDSAHIDDRGVVIGAGCIVEPGAVLHAGVTLEDGVVIRSGAVIGNTGFEHKRTTKGVVSVIHDGGVRIGRKTEVGTLVNIAQGFIRRETIIGADVRIDSLSHVAHGCQIADAVFIAAGVTISGSVTIGEGAWIGPGAVISNQLTIGARSRVGIGSVVLRDVADDARVLGNPARAQP